MDCSRHSLLVSRGKGLLCRGTNCSNPAVAACGNAGEMRVLLKGC